MKVARMGSGLSVVARLHHRLLPSLRRAWLRQLMLVISLVVLTLGVVGMHQLSVDHDVSTGQSVVSGQPSSAAHSAYEAGATATDHHRPQAGAEPATGAAGSDEQDCPSCAGHQMALSTCLLALTLLVLTWLLAPPRLRHLPPFLLPRLAYTSAVTALGRLVPSLTLTELSLRRT